MVVQASSDACTGMRACYKIVNAPRLVVTLQGVKSVPEVAQTRHNVAIAVMSVLTHHMVAAQR